MNLAIYYCTVCKCNVADHRGWPVWDCLRCGALPEKLAEERRPSRELVKALENPLPREDAEAQIEAAP